MISTALNLETVQVGCDAGFDWPAWDRFVDGCPGGTFYHRSGWLKAVAGGLGHDIRLHLVRDGGEIGAGAFVRRAAKLGICAGRKPWGTGYNGVISASGEAGPLARQLRAELLRVYHQVRLVQAPGAGVEEWEPPWRVTLSKTPVLDLRDMGKLWDSFDRRARQRVRKAEGLGVTAGASACFGDFADLYRMTYARQGLPMPLAAKSVEEVLRRVVESGDARLFMAKTALGEPAAGLLAGFQVGRVNGSAGKSGIPHAQRALRSAAGGRPDVQAGRPHHNGRAWFVLAASHPTHRKTDAVTYLWWHAMEQCAGLVSEIDLVGHGVGRIDQFKSSFSPRLVDHWECEAYGNGPAGWALRALDLRRRRGRGTEDPT
ncbi:MAG: hypothetical protein NTZ09_01690 [Candidatus Hydrogenedentes bacterium]|nr:hypothetical protein [Candidatus Hydrogenedentota bacterium]